MHLKRNLALGILVSPEDITILIWNRFFIDSDGYPRTNIKKVSTLLHSLVMPTASMVDHKDRIKLNCTKNNLRDATYSINTHNRGLQKNNTSGYKGVTFSQGKWKMQIRLNGTRIRGTFNTAKEAALEYNRLALEHHGEYAAINLIL